MAMTPYPNGNDLFENPSIKVSQDGYTWRLVEGSVDPIVSETGNSQTHHSDPQILLKKGEFYLFFRRTDKVKNCSTILYRKSVNLVNWTDEVVVFVSAWCLSPSFLNVDDQWLCWYIELEGVNSDNMDSAIFFKTGQSLDSLSEPVKCGCNIDNYRPWHIEVKKFDNNYEALINAFPVHRRTNRQTLFHFKSASETSWKEGVLLLKPSLFGWDNGMIYKSSFLKIDNGDYRVWYSACSYGIKWFIGHIILSGGRAHYNDTNTLNISSVKQLRHDIIRFFVNVVRKVTPAPVIKRLKRLL